MNTRIKESYRKIAPSSEQRTRMYENIIDGIEKKRYHRPLKKILKPALVAVACLALILGVSRVPDFVTLKKVVNNDEPGTVAEKIANAFTVKVVAAGKKKTVTKDSPVPILLEGEDKSEVFSCETVEAKDVKKRKNDLYVTYCVNFPITIEGENIDTITYSINKGFFQVFSKTGDNYVMDGVKYQGEWSYVPACPPEGYYPDGDQTKFKDIGKGYDKGVYTSYKFSADKQGSKDIAINLCGNILVTPETYMNLWYYDGNLDRHMEGRNALYGDIIISCDITFKDGKKQTLKIRRGNKIMTLKEAGWDVSDKEQNKKSVFATYELIE